MNVDEKVTAENNDIETLSPETEEKYQSEKYEILPEITQENFLRKAWITLAKEDAPMEIFESNFQDVLNLEHQVLIDTFEGEFSYQASVGYDREEPYIAYEDYYEDEPYITTESYYDSTTKTTRQRQVTKYKKVKKQRQVTKYKTVTDWSPINGEYNGSPSVAVVENLKGQTLDEGRFVTCYRGLKNESVIPASDDIVRRMSVTEEANDAAVEEHKRAISRSIGYSLPGDHYRDLSWKTINVKNTSASLYKTPEYEVSIKYGQKTYTKRAFPFGPISIVGDKIKNEESLRSATTRMRKELKEFSDEKRKAIDKKVSAQTSPIAFLSIGLLLGSIAVSFLIPSMFLVICMFAASIIANIVCNLSVKSSKKSITEKAEEEIKAETGRVESEIENYSTNYKAKLYETLNKKLESLGFEPATEEEL